ncbi:hypothetical protein [Halorussus salinisoli]|uniref:hypothetical protein n=1 Tax=Halorussus salinisoli TaxID=2558242 RepID=UPI0010C19C3D|nr:hypothetical protein [Halorussus salinisoli]
MATVEMNQLRSRLDESGSRTALVRGAAPPPRPPETVTVEPGVAASVGPDGRRAPLYVTAEAPSSRTVRQYDGPDVSAVADCAADLTADRDPRAVWLCGRDQIRSWWGDGVVDLLERRLAATACRASARLVVWASEDDGTGGDSEAVEDRYDVVLDP